MDRVRQSQEELREEAVVTNIEIAETEWMEEADTASMDWNGQQADRTSTKADQPQQSEASGREIETSQWHVADHW